MNLLRQGVEVQPAIALRHDLRGHSPVTRPEAREVIAVVRTTMLAGLPHTWLRDAIFTHPTMTDRLNVLLANVPTGRRQITDPGRQTGATRGFSQRCNASI
jgi:hypothetical protein